MKNIFFLSRTELGYCGIEYKETTGTSIDAFAIFSTATNTLAIKAALAESTDGNDFHHRLITIQIKH